MAANIQRLKLSVFAERYWQDEESRPCRDTLVSHIKRGWLSGKTMVCRMYQLGCAVVLYR